jgi:hypothetical protein
VYREGELTDLATVRSHLELPASDTSRDALITTLIEQASSVIYRHCGREFKKPTPDVEEARIIRVDPERRFGRLGYYFVDLYPYDVRSITSAELHYGAADQQNLVVGTDIVVEPLATATPTSPYPHVLLSPNLVVATGTAWANFGYADLRITGLWGWPQMPKDVDYACVVTVASWLRRDVTEFALEMGDARGLAPEAPATFALPMAAVRVLEHYRRRPV